MKALRCCPSFAFWFLIMASLQVTAAEKGLPTTRPVAVDGESKEFRASQEDRVDDWLKFRPYSAIYRYIRAHSQEYELTRPSEGNRIQKLSIFCTKKNADEVLGFWIETGGQKRECYVFEDTSPKRLDYGVFLDKVGLAGVFEEIDLKTFEKEVGLPAANQEFNVEIAKTAEEKNALLKKMEVLAAIRKFIETNNDPAQPSVTDAELMEQELKRQAQEVDKLMEEFRRAAEAARKKSEAKQ